MALYRTYRPQSFEDVVGQDHVVTTLQNAVKQDRLSHAYLFAGVRGTGKTSIARILAKHLLTKNVEENTLKKQILKAVEEGNIVDLTEIDAASNTGVDNIRDLIEKIQFTPVVASAKVYIIDEVHMLSKGAFNALLKTLEEPPAYAYFILATTELHKIPLTIQSRCQRYLFHQINEKDIVKRLRYIAKEENIEVEEDALFAIARHVQGGLRDAISLLDQLRALPNITVTDVKERVGETGHEHVAAVLAAMRSIDHATLLRVTRDLEETGVPLENFVRLLLAAVRDELHAHVRENQYTEGQRHMMETLLQCARDLRIAPVPGLVLEAALLSLCSPRKPEPAPVAASPAPLPPPPPPHAHTKNAKEAPVIVETILGTTPISIETLRQLWPAVLAKVQPPSARMSLTNGQLHSIQGSTVTIRFSSSFHREKASTPQGSHSAEEALQQACGQKLHLTFVLDSDLHAPPPVPLEERVDLAAAALDVF